MEIAIITKRKRGESEVNELSSEIMTKRKKEESEVNELSSQLASRLHISADQNGQEIDGLSSQLATTLHIRTARDRQEINELVSQLKSSLSQERDKEVIRYVESTFRHRFRILVRKFNRLIVEKNALVSKRDCGDTLLSRLSKGYKLDNLEALDEEVLQAKISELRSVSEELKVQIGQMDQDFLKKKKSEEELIESQELYINTLKLMGAVKDILRYIDNVKNTVFKCDLILDELPILKGSIASNKAALEEKLQKCKSSNVGNSSNLSKINSIESIVELEIEIAGNKRAVIDKDNEIRSIDLDSAKLAKDNTTLETKLHYKALFDYATDKFLQNPENCIWKR